jgi:RNA polymerase sigma factor (sigma-70 family)
VSDAEQLEARLNEQFEFLWEMVAREVGSRHLPSDLVGEVVDHVIVVVYERWEKGKGRTLPPEAWRASLTTIARNEVNNVVRRVRKRRAEVPLPDDIPNPRSHDHDRLLDQLTEPQVRAAIETLGEPERSLLRLTVFDGMKLGEAADMLGLDPDIAARAMRSLVDKVHRLRAGGTVKGSKAAGVTAFTRALTMLMDRGDGRG